MWLKIAPRLDSVSFSILLSTLKAAVRLKLNQFVFKFDSVRPGHLQNAQFSWQGQIFNASSGSQGKHPNEKWMFCSILPVL